MSHNLTISNTGNKSEIYEALIPQIKALVTGESDFIANLANIAAALQESFKFLWIGFYRIKGDALILGPFQGPIACTRIQKGKGVCGKSWETGTTLIVDDVDLFDGHIACSSLSKSEIVVPYFFPDSKNVAGVLDVDSASLADFDETDKKYLEKVAEIISHCLKNSND